MIHSIISTYLAWTSEAPDVNKICGKSPFVSITGEDGVNYKYYASSYTTGNDCDTHLSAKALTNGLSDALDRIHAEKTDAVCLSLDDGSTWHGVLGLATEGSGKNSQEICSDVYADMTRFITINSNPLPLEGRSPWEPSDADTTQRTGFSVHKAIEKKNSTTFSAPNRSQQVVMGLAFAIYRQSVNKRCDPITGHFTDYEGRAYTYFYEASGWNCNTNAELRTIVSALNDKWDSMGKNSAVCMVLHHGQAWQGYLGVSAMQSRYPAQNLC